MNGLSSALAIMDASISARNSQREADAALVEAAGCHCKRAEIRKRWDDPTTLFKDEMDGEPDPPGIHRVVYLPDHEPWCHVVLAAKIRGGA